MAFPLLPLLLLGGAAIAVASTRTTRKARTRKGSGSWFSIPNSNPAPSHDEWYMDAATKEIIRYEKIGILVRSSSGKSLDELSKNNIRSSRTRPPIGFVLDNDLVPLGDIDPKLRDAFRKNVTVVRILPQYIRLPWLAARRQLINTFIAQDDGEFEEPKASDFESEASDFRNLISSMPIINFEELALELSPSAAYVSYLSDLGRDGTLEALSEVFKTDTSGEKGAEVFPQVIFIMERSEICDPYPMTGRIGFGPRMKYWPAEITTALLNEGWCYTRRKRLGKVSAMPFGEYDHTWELWGRLVASYTEYMPREYRDVWSRILSTPSGWIDTTRSENEKFAFPYAFKSSKEGLWRDDWNEEGGGLSGHVTVSTAMEWGPTPMALGDGPSKGILISHDLRRESWDVISLTRDGALLDFVFTVSDRNVQIEPMEPQPDWDETPDGYPAWWTMGL